MIREGVRDEVRLSVQPIEGRLEVQENISKDLGVQVKNLVTELKAS